MLKVEQLLDRSPFFKDLSKVNRKKLAVICIGKNYRKNERLFWEGDKGYAFFLMESGVIQLYKMGPDGREVVIKTVRQGEIFAEVILFEENRYPVSAEAVKESRVYTIPKHQYICLLEDRAFRDDYIRLLLRKQRYLTDRIVYLTSYGVADRFYIFLKEQFGMKERIECELSKKDMAAAIGVTPESLSRHLLRLREKGWLTWNNKNINITQTYWDEGLTHPQF